MTPSDEAARAATTKIRKRFKCFLLSNGRSSLTGTHEQRAQAGVLLPDGVDFRGVARRANLSVARPCGCGSRGETERRHGEARDDEKTEALQEVLLSVAGRGYKQLSGRWPVRLSKKSLAFSHAQGG